MERLQKPGYCKSLTLNNPTKLSLFWDRDGTGIFGWRKRLEEIKSAVHFPTFLHGPQWSVI